MLLLIPQQKEMVSGKFFNEKLKVSRKSAFSPWIKPLEKNILMDLVESGVIRLSDKNKLLTPFEAAIWLDSLKIKFTLFFRIF